MSEYIPIGLLLVLMAVAYQVGLSRSRAVATTAGPTMHSRSNYHGMLVALWCAVPAAIVLLLWLFFGSRIETAYVLSQLPPEASAPGVSTAETLRRVQQIASGFGTVNESSAAENAAGQALREFRVLINAAVLAFAAALGVAGLVYARRRIAPRLRARNEVEKAITILMVACSAVAILTTFGIVASLVTEAMRFFTFINPADFFFGTVWNPGFSTTAGGTPGQYGLLPLLWGTVMIAIIAMLVAIPVGLMTAIYLAEYAPKSVRAVAKPIIEVLAGIPTIVFGFFALVAVGPFLSALGAQIGIDIRATSALTAGIVMGIMIIPFISSLSDDIITQVPKTMRDGSLGLGATHSETIRKVILPAALPGIVGAILLAVSRAVGETMIVVLAAGNAPVLHVNPFEAVSTVTVTIVNQLTGDADFAGPQSLVAFALGLTLFVATLGLNIVALAIVRKYREQYE